MKNKRRYFSLLLCIVLIFSVLSSSCAEESALPVDDPQTGGDISSIDNSPPENGGEGISDEDLLYVIYHYEYIDTLVSYVGPEDSQYRPHYEWRNDEHIPEAEMTPFKCIIERKPWSEDMLPFKPGGIFNGHYERYYSYTTVYTTVYDWLESEETGARQFWIRPNKYYQEDRKNYDSQEAYLAAWCEEYLPDGTVVDGLGFVLWEGTAAELVDIAEYDNRIIVCFPEDFDAIYGMTVEQAEILIERGILGDWSSPVPGSALYSLAPTKIAAYLAEHPELLEE